jgi:hypothetical protein
VRDLMKEDARNQCVCVCVCGWGGVGSYCTQVGAGYACQWSAKHMPAGTKLNSHM